MNTQNICNRIPVSRVQPEFIALMAALQLKGASTTALQELTANQWSQLLEVADLAHLTLFLSEVRSDGFPQWVAERLKRNVADNEARFERVKRTYEEAAAALERAHIEFMVLKGFTQSPDYVKNPRLRTQSDLDLFCPLEGLERAKTALEGIGYEAERSMEYSRADHLPAMIRRGSWAWRGNPFDPDMPLSIELHFCLWNEPILMLPVADVELLWNRRVSRTLEEIKFPALNRIDHLGYLALHILRNILAGDWVVHHVYELSRFLHEHANDDGFWDEWTATHSNYQRSLEAIAFAHAKAWFRCDVHQSVDAEILQLSPGVAQWLRLFSGSSLEGMFRLNRDWVLLHAALLSTAKEKRAVLFRAIVPKKIPSRSSPAIGLRHRRTRKISTRPNIQYISYLVSRTVTQAYLVPAMLFHGFEWWLLQRQLGKRFWTFLGASFFLT
ncbi:MAG TPA: nucleotidyltransferase family protein [Acidisarcina sp.]|nr:nucleotidyltransferase family protein [Acidisarcina sp.]